jgi:hypothetical protein
VETLVNKSASKGKFALSGRVQKRDRVIGRLVEPLSPMKGGERKRERERAHTPVSNGENSETEGDQRNATQRGAISNTLSDTLVIILVYSYVRLPRFDYARGSSLPDF